MIKQLFDDFKLIATNIALMLRLITRPIVDGRVVVRLGKWFDLGMGDAMRAAKFTNGEYAILLWFAYVKTLSIYDLNDELSKSTIRNSLKMPKIISGDEKRDEAFQVSGQDKEGNYLVRAYFNIKFEELNRKDVTLRLY